MSINSKSVPVIVDVSSDDEDDEDLPTSNKKQRLVSKKKDFRPHRCDQCPPQHKGFAMLKQLKQHKKVVHGPKEFKCNLCQMEFTRDNDLQAHFAAIHTSVKNHKCDVEGCEKEYGTTYALRLHKKSHNEKEMCPYCPTTFSRSSSLKAHIQSIHPNNAEGHQKTQRFLPTTSRNEGNNSQTGLMQMCPVFEENTPPDDITVSFTETSFRKSMRPGDEFNVIILLSKKFEWTEDTSVFKYWVSLIRKSVEDRILEARDIGNEAFRRNNFKQPLGTKWTANALHVQRYCFIGPNRRHQAEQYKFCMKIAQILKTFLIRPTLGLNHNSEIINNKFSVYSKFLQTNLLDSVMSNNNIQINFKGDDKSVDFRRVPWPDTLAIKETLLGSPHIYYMMWFHEELFKIYAGLNPTGQGVIAGVHSKPNDTTAAGLFIKDHPELKFHSGILIKCKPGSDEYVTEGISTLAILLGTQKKVKLLHTDGKHYPIELLNKEFKLPAFLLCDHIKLIQYVSMYLLKSRFNLSAIDPNMEVNERVSLPDLGDGSFLECDCDESNDESDFPLDDN